MLEIAVSKKMSPTNNAFLVYINNFFSMHSVFLVIAVECVFCKKYLSCFFPFIAAECQKGSVKGKKKIKPLLYILNSLADKFLQSFLILMDIDSKLSK